MHGFRADDFQDDGLSPIQIALALTGHPRPALATELR